MAEVDMLSLVKDIFGIHVAGITQVNEVDAFHFQYCVSRAIWKDKAEAEAVLRVLIEIAGHKDVILTDADALHNSLLVSIAAVAKATLELGQPS